MNIFVLDRDPITSAHMACNAHVVKIALEVHQMLSIPFHLQNLPALTKGPSHRNHPVSIWVRESRENYEWTCEHGLALCEEYRVRYGIARNRQHTCYEKIRDSYKRRKRLSFDTQGLTEFAQAMPNTCRQDDPVQAYRTYYAALKRHIFSWSVEPPPDWLTERFRFVEHPKLPRWDYEKLKMEKAKRRLKANGVLRYRNSIVVIP